MSLEGTYLSAKTFWYFWTKLKAGICAWTTSHVRTAATSSSTNKLSIRVESLTIGNPNAAEVQVQHVRVVIEVAREV